MLNKSDIKRLLANALIHADYHGRQGIVIEKRFRRLMFRNPGCLRMSKEAAIGGGRSDARNSLIFNFALINIGERSGTGLSDIYSIWKECGYEEPTITETYQPDQTMVTVQVELEEGTTTAQESAVKTANIAVKESDAGLRENIIEKCAELYCFLRVDPRRTILTAVESLGFSSRFGAATVIRAASEKFK